jgi:hypothetical protein
MISCAGRKRARRRRAVLRGGPYYTSTRGRRGGGGGRAGWRCHCADLERPLRSSNVQIAQLPPPPGHRRAPRRAATSLLLMLLVLLLTAAGTAGAAAVWSPPPPPAAAARSAKELPQQGEKPSTCKPLHEHSCWYDANPIRSIWNSSVAQCCAACDKEPKCTCWTLNHAERATCFLKPGIDIQKHPGNCTSGGTVSPPPPPPPPPPPAPKNAKNVLMILIDDIRPELSNYGSHVPTPNFEKFSKSALTLTNAYVQYSFCCPSRNSFLSGRRPSKTKVWTFADHFREAATGANWTALPQWFKDSGYFTHGLGKLL